MVSNPLDVHLLDLRAQLEGQLRCLDHVKHLLNEVERIPATDRPVYRDRMLMDLREIERIGRIVTIVADEARQSVEDMSI